MYDSLFLKQINYLTQEMTFNCPKISAAGFFDVGYNLILMVNLAKISSLTENFKNVIPFDRGIWFCS